MTELRGVPVLGPDGRPVGPTRDRETWKAERVWRVGSSDAAAILGKDEYTGPWEVWDRIVLGDWSDAEGADIRRGNRQEPAARQCFVERTGLDVQEVGMVHHPDDERIVTDLDGLILRPEEWPEPVRQSELWGAITNQRGPGWLELKVPRVGTFYRYKEEGLPKRYIVQGQHHGMVTGLAWGFYAFYTPEYDDLVAFPVLTDREFTGWLFDALHGWLRDHVDARVRPERFAPEPPRWPAKVPGEAAMRDDDAWMEMAELLTMRHYEFEEAKAAYDQTEDAVVQLLEPGATHVAGGGVTVKRRSTRTQRRWDPKAFRAAVKLAQQEGDTQALLSIDPDDDAFYYETGGAEKVEVTVRGPNPFELMREVA